MVKPATVQTPNLIQQRDIRRPASMGKKTNYAIRRREFITWRRGPCPCRNLRPEILVVQFAQNWHRQRATDRVWTARGIGASLCSDRCVRASVFLVGIEQMAQMLFAAQHMVETIPSDRTDEPLRVSILVWRQW